MKLYYTKNLVDRQISVGGRLKGSWGRLGWTQRSTPTPPQLHSNPTQVDLFQRSLPRISFFNKKKSLHKKGFYKNKIYKKIYLSTTNHPT